MPIVITDELLLPGYIEVHQYGDFVCCVGPVSVGEKCARRGRVHEYPAVRQCAIKDLKYVLRRDGYQLIDGRDEEGVILELPYPYLSYEALEALFRR